MMNLKSREATEIMQGHNRTLRFWPLPFSLELLQAAEHATAFGDTVKKL